MTTTKLAFAIAFAGASPLIGIGIYGIAHERENWVGVVSTVAVGFLMLLGGSFVSMIDATALRAAIVGLGLALVIASLSFVPWVPIWLTRSDFVLLALCPPSIISMGLDNAGLAQVGVTWFYIALINGALYAMVVASLRWLWRHGEIGLVG